jgi:hypothetical protein
MSFEDYLANLPLLHSWDGGKTWSTGGFSRDLLETLYRFLRDKLPEGPVILETGAGNSTIMFLYLSPARLVSIAPDPPLFERIRGFCQGSGMSDVAIEAHADGSQWVLPRLAAENRGSDAFLDFALIDGCHGWPTAFLDLEYANFMLRKGGYLMIDDVQLHSLKEMARLLAEHPAYVLELDLGKALVFRKRSVQRHLGEWNQQPYIARRTARYARSPDPYALHGPRVAFVMKRLLRRLLFRVRARP